MHNGRILRGVYLDERGWRWTAPSFAFRLDPQPAPKPSYLELMKRESYRKVGRNLLVCQVPQSALTRRPAEVEFSADRWIADPATSRSQALIVVSAGLKQFEQTFEFREAELARSRKAYEEVVKQRDLKMPVEKQREIMRLFHDLPIWESMWFHNVRIIKNPLDLWMLQQIAYEVRPDFVIETGTWYGGSALYWAHTLNGMGLENGRVLTVDMQDLTMHGADPIRSGRSTWNSLPAARRIPGLFRTSRIEPKEAASRRILSRAPVPWPPSGSSCLKTPVATSNRTSLAKPW